MGDRSSAGLLTDFLIRRRVRAAAPHVRGTVLDHGCGPGGLALRVPPERYLGYDVDEAVLAVARARHPSHRFTRELLTGERFDTVVSLAVIEHVDDPVEYLRSLAMFVRDEGRVVLSTPHPRSRSVYQMGARLGLFSKLASEEHHRLLGRHTIAVCAAAAGLRVCYFGTFMASANQLAVLEPARP